MPCNCGNITLPTGSNGLNGYNAFTVTTASFAMPAVGVSVTIAVSASSQYTGIWAALGDYIFITDGTSPEFYQVTTAGTQTAIGVKNLGYVGTTPTTVASGAKVSPAGYRGAAGTNGTNGVAILKIDATPAECKLTNYTTKKTLTLANTTFTQNEDAIEIEFVLMSDIISATGAVASFRLTMDDGTTPAITLTETVDYLTQGVGIKYRMIVAESTTGTKVTPYKEAWIGNSNTLAYAATPTRLISAPALMASTVLAESSAIILTNAITLNLDLKVANISDKIKVIYWKVTHLKK